MVCFSCFAASHCLARKLCVDTKQATALTYTNGMFNTGLAFVVSPVIVTSAGLALLAPLVVTVVQHSVASVWDAWSGPRRHDP